jgi:crotonobetainyl-CoA:carnitine CoA-transferase CaiB-like acyl-CoA transferase
VPVNALAGVRVLDLTQYIAGPYCTKLLADFGADVLKIERPPAGDPARRLGPFPNDTPHLETSAPFLHLNTNKRSLTLNLKTEEGRRIALRLAERADVLVENFRPGTLARLGLDVNELHARNPRLVVTSISNFGQSGPYRDLKASEITLYAMGGPMNVTGHRDHEPLKLGGNVVQYHAGAVAAFATMVALYAVEGGRPYGEHIDVSIYETQAGFRDRRTVYLTAHAYTGDIGRRPEAGVRPGVGVRPAKDGYVNIFAGGPDRFVRFLRMIGREDLIGDERTRNPLLLNQHPELAQEIEHRYLEWLMAHPKREAAAIAQQHRLLAAPVNEIRDVVEDPAFNERGAFEVIDHPYTGPLKYAGRPFIMSATPRPPARRAPLLGEHTVQVLCEELGYRREDVARLRAQGVV